MSALDELFTEAEHAEIAAMAADARLSPDEFVRGIVLEVLDIRRVDQMRERMESGEEPTIGLDELRDCSEKPY